LTLSAGSGGEDGTVIESTAGSPTGVGMIIGLHLANLLDWTSSALHQQ
jgi:hypothetical protein